MAKTTNAYIADAPGATVTISAANVTDHAAFTTAEDLQCNITVKDMQPQVAARPAAEAFVGGADAPVLARSTKTGGKYTLEINCVDDYFLGQTGEIGTDTLTSFVVMNAFFQSAKTLGGFAYAPAGDVAGRIEVTLTTCYVEHVGQPQADGSSGDVASFPVTLSAEDFSYATIV